VACRTRRPKPELLRIVRSPAGDVAYDPGGKAPGRGAYVCRDPACVRVALRKGGLARALGSTLRNDDLARLSVEIEQEIAS
jgi:predicted RNA-binding protein YlxR (DUF448 family)